jgi:hypothetical protein
LIAYFFISQCSYAQNTAKDSLEQDEITLGYDSNTTLYDYRLFNQKFNKNRTQLCFFDHFSDSISVLLNDQIVISKWFKADSLSKLSIVMLKAKNKKGNYVKIIMHKTRRYIEFPLDKRYRFVEIFFSRDEAYDNDYWNINFTNNVPHRD